MTTYSPPIDEKNDAAVLRAFAEFTDADITMMRKNADARAEGLATAISAISAIADAAEDGDILDARDTLRKALDDAKASRSLLWKAYGLRRDIAIADAVANPTRFPERVIVFRHGYTPPGWKKHTKVRLIEWDRGRGYAEGLHNGEWFMVGDIHHVEDLDGKYI